MATISVSVPDTLRKKIRQREDINWSSVARQAFEQRIADEEFLLETARHSKLTQKDAHELAIRINRLVSRRPSSER